MSNDQQEIIDRALSLPPEARAALAAQLLESLDGAVDSDPEKLWSEEIARRIAAIDCGAVTTIPWAEARDEILGSDDPSSKS